MTFANKMNRQFQAVSRRQDEMEEKMEGNIKETRQNSQEIEKLREELNKMKSTLESEREAKNDMLGEELRDREARRNNLIIHGLQEANMNTNPRERMERDKQLCGELLAAIGTRTRAVDLRFCRRVGEKGREARPVVIGVRSEEEKRNILDRAADLRKTRFSNVSVGPDMTRMQRRAEDQLAKEVEKRNEQLTTEDREKNLRWMVVGRRGEKRMVKGVEREQQNFGRGEVQLGDFLPHEQRETGARRKEYYQQQTPTLGGPTLLAPRQQNNPNYIPVQHTRQHINQQQNYQQQPYLHQPYQQQQQPYLQPHQQQQYGNRFGNGPSNNSYNSNGSGYNNGNRNGGGYSNGNNSSGYSGNTGSGGGYGGSGNSGNGGGNGNNSSGYSGYSGNNGSGGGYGGSGNSGNGGGNSGTGNNGSVFNNSGTGYGNNNNSSGYGNIQLTWRGGQTNNNDSGYTEPNWQERRYDENGERPGNTNQRTPDRPNSTAADTHGTNEGMRPRVNSKRGREVPDPQTEDGPPRARPRQ
jgi:hypothetical protein